MASSSLPKASESRPSEYDTGAATKVPLPTSTIRPLNGNSNRYSNPNRDLHADRHRDSHLYSNSNRNGHCHNPAGHANANPRLRKLLCQL